MPATGSPLRFALLAAAVVCLFSACGERNTYQPPPPAEVSVAKPEQRKVTLYLEVTGSTAPSTDYWLARALTHWRPRISIVEYNAVFGSERAITALTHLGPLHQSGRAVTPSLCGATWWPPRCARCPRLEGLLRRFRESRNATAVRPTCAEMIA